MGYLESRRSPKTAEGSLGCGYTALKKEIRVSGGDRTILIPTIVVFRNLALINRGYFLVTGLFDCFLRDLSLID